MKAFKIIQPADRVWAPHPTVAGAKSALLISNREEKAVLTCMLTHLPPGSKVDAHRHACDEMIYIIRGSMMMRIEGVGELTIKQGGFVRIPRGIVHQPTKVQKDLMAYNVFYPYLL